MNKYMIGKKIGMTQLFDETGKVIPVTVVETTGSSSDSAEMQHKNKVNSKQQKKTKILDLSKLDVQQYLKPSASVMSVVNNENVDSRVTNFKLGIRFESWDVASAIIKVINTKGKSEIYQYKGGKVLILTFPDMSLIEALQICNTLIEYDNSKWLNSCQISKVGSMVR